MRAREGRGARGMWVLAVQVQRVAQEGGGWGGGSQVMSYSWLVLSSFSNVYNFFIKKKRVLGVQVERVAQELISHSRRSNS
jgi:hypothetical protein